MERIKQLRRWVCWNATPVKGRMTKVPCAANGGATGTDEKYAHTWVTYEEAVEAMKRNGYTGVGFVIPEGVFFIDKDHVDPNAPVAQELLRRFPSYAERSYSGNGVHFFGMCDLSRIPVLNGKLDKRYYTKNPHNGLEVYIGSLTNRFAAFTDEPIQDLPLADCTDALLELLEKDMRREKEPQPVQEEIIDEAVDEDDPRIGEIIEALRWDRNAPKFVRLFDEGDITGYASQSEADAALCAIIAFRAGPNPALIDAIFRRSALYRDDKWERADYRASTIQCGIAARRGVYHHSTQVKPFFVMQNPKSGVENISSTRLAQFIREKLRYFFETKAQELYKDETGRVAGVFAVKDGELILFKASKGVVLATGGMHEDKEMVEYYCDDFVNRVQRCEHGPAGFSTGDGHKMGLWAGAKMQEGPFPLMLHPQANAMFHGCFPFLNQRGERFMNEGTWVQGKSMNIMHRPGNIAWSVFDKNWAHYNTLSLETGEGGGMFWDSMAGAIGQPFTDDDLVATVESDIANGNTIKADTLEELAEKTGMPYEALKASLDRYNALVEAGEDTDFRKAKSMLFPVKEGPFYAAKVGIALLAIVGGLMVDDNLNVVDDNDQPIPGLYAIGNASGGTYAVDYPINMAGNSNGRCLIWGYLAGKTLGGVESTVACTDIASCGVVPGPVEHTVVDATVYKDGVYNGVGTGRNGDIEVAVTIEGGKISGIEVVRQAETDNIGVPAFEKLIANAVKGNTAAVDTVGGATMTSDGFRKAVAAALELAK